MHEHNGASQVEVAKSRSGMYSGSTSLWGSAWGLEKADFELQSKLRVSTFIRPYKRNLLHNPLQGVQTLRPKAHIISPMIITPFKKFRLQLIWRRRMSGLGEQPAA